MFLFPLTSGVMVASLRAYRARRGWTHSYLRSSRQDNHISVIGPDDGHDIDCLVLQASTFVPLLIEDGERHPHFARCQFAIGVNPECEIPFRVVHLSDYVWHLHDVSFSAQHRLRRFGQYIYLATTTEHAIFANSDWPSSTGIFSVPWNPG